MDRHVHTCPGFACLIAATCAACDLEMTPPRRPDAMPARPHGHARCNYCRTVVLICPLGETEAQMAEERAEA